MNIRLLTVVLVSAFTAIHFAAAADAQHPDKWIGRKAVTGRLLSYQEGDYAHASVRPEHGNDQSFFVDDEICFLASNLKEALTIEYDEVERFFPEGDAYFPANVIRSITTKPGEKHWIRESNLKPTPAQQNECAGVLRTAFIPTPK